MVVVAVVTFDDGLDFVDLFGVYWVVVLWGDFEICYFERRRRMLWWYIFVE